MQRTISISHSASRYPTALVVAVVVWTPTSAMWVVVVEDDGVIDTAAGGGYCDEADYDVRGFLSTCANEV
jgi:hypothetical protein